MPVIISGTGAISGAGSGARSLLAGCRQRSPDQIVPSQDRPPFYHSFRFIAAHEFDPVAVLGKKGLQFLTRGTQLLMGAAYQAIGEAAFDLGSKGAELGLVIGTNLANLATMANYDWTVVSEGPSYVSPMDAPNTLANAPASQLAIRLGAKNVNTTISTGCCASLDSIGYAAHFLQEMRANAVLAGGTEEVNPYVLWQLDGDGIHCQAEIPGEGAAAMLLELEPINESGTRGLARFNAWTNNLAPEYPPERLVQDVSAEALELACMKPDQIRLIGLDIATENDLPLVEGVWRALVESHSNFRPLPAFSLKQLVGQTLGAAGALYAVAVVKAFESKQVPSTVALAPGLWPKELMFGPTPQDFEPGPALVVGWDPRGFASAVILSPSN
jgi:3-oxoacyl-[acyl-carrier-protein] synthase II